jgi:hypothetical protein
MWNRPRSRAKSRLLPRRLRVSLAQNRNPLLLSRRSSALDNFFGKLDHGRAGRKMAKDRSVRWWQQDAGKEFCHNRLAKSRWALSRAAIASS